MSINKNKGFSIVLIFMIFISMIPVNVFAEELRYETRKKMENVSLNKTFKIKFSRELNPTSIQGRVRIFDYKQESINVNVKLDPKDARVLIVKPTSNMVPGKDYMLEVSPYVTDTSGKKLGVGIKQPFKVNNIFAGLPYKEGAIYVNYTVYSLDYLTKNASAKNEIINGGDKIYYLYDVKDNKIKDIIGDKFIDGITNPPNLDKDRPITHVDANGKKSIYVWNKETTLYEKIDPYVQIKLTTSYNNINAKVVSMKVEETKGIYGAYYFEPENSNKLYKIDGESAVYTTNNVTEKITIYSQSKTKLAEGYIRAIRDGSMKVLLSIYQKKSEGNTAGNIVNNGYVAVDNMGFIYYNNTTDKNKLYKKEINGSINEPISDDYGQYINVVGDWIYYSNYNDKGKIYKMKTNGTGRVKLNDDYSSYITIVGDWIYYCNQSDGGRIYKMQKDGSSRQPIGGTNQNNYKDETAYINLYDDWIYYVNKSDRNKIYKVNENGHIKVNLTEEGASSIQLVGDWIFYADSKGNLKKVKEDGSKQSVNINAQAVKFDKGFHFNVDGEWVYYSNAQDKGKLYKIAADGSGKKELICDMEVTYISIIDDDIYFISKDKLYKLPLDATKNTKPEQVSKGAGDITIKQIDDRYVTVAHEHINLGIQKIEEMYLPEKVPAILSNNKQELVPVLWDVKNVKVQNGMRIYTGNIIGYNKSIKLYMTIPSEMLNSANTIQIYTNPGSGKSKIEISNEFTTQEFTQPAKLLVGDEVRIYDDPLLKKVLKTAKVVRDGNLNKATLSGLKLDKTGTVEYYITVIRKNKTESEPTKIIVGDIPEIINSVHVPVRDDDDLGVKVDGRDFHITDWRQGSIKTYTKHEVYIATQSTLDFSDYKVRPIDEIKVVNGKEQPWAGKKEHLVDSLGVQLKQAKYNLFVASYYEELASPDKNGSRPNVLGKIVSEPEPIEAKEDVVPKEPTLKTESKQAGGKVSLSYTPKDGEIAFLVPTEIYLNGTMNTEIYNDFRIWLGEKDKGFSNIMNSSVIPPDFYDAFVRSDLYAKYKSVISQNIITMLVGDGREKEINIPKGMQPVEKGKYNENYLDVRYKLIIFNKVGASSASKGILTVDNRPPIIKADDGSNYFVKDKDKFVAGMDYIRIQSVGENATLYLVRTEDTLNTVEQLEQAVSAKKAYKYNLKAGATEDIMTSGIKAVKEDSRLNYKIYLADSVGNITNSYIYEADDSNNITIGKIINICVYVKCEKLEGIIKDARKAIMDGELTSANQERLLAMVSEAEKMIADIDNFDMTRVVSQREIDLMVEKLQKEMMSVGAVHRYMDAYEVVKTLQNKFRELREYGYKSNAVDMNNITTDLWLPTVQKVPNTRGGTDTVKIEWIPTSDPDKALAVSGDRGKVTRPADMNPAHATVELKATFTIENRLNVSTNEKENYSDTNVYYLKVKPLELMVEANNPRDNTFVINSDFKIGSQSQIGIYLRDTKVGGGWTLIPEYNVYAKCNIMPEGNSFRVAIDIDETRLPASFAQMNSSIMVKVDLGGGRVVGSMGKLSLDVRYNGALDIKVIN